MIWSVIDALTVLGVAVVLPLALGGPRGAWAVATIGAVLALLLPRGPLAASLVVPWVAVAASLARHHLAAMRTGMPSPAAAAAAAAAAVYAVVAAWALVASRAGVSLFGIGEPIVQLTAVHYTYAGSAALILSARALEAAPARLGNVATIGMVLTAVAPPVVALGFVTGGALAQVGGAVLMTLGVFVTAALHLLAAVTAETGSSTARLLLAVSGLAVWIPMVLAVTWAAGQHWDVPVLSIQDMARTHGVANAAGFILCGLTGRKLQDARSRRCPCEAMLR
jgi:hypothetical protein